MEKEFWQQAWEDKKIGFHQPKYNPFMVEHYKDQNLEGKRVLIPLAGKSNDILYFLERGAHVVAIELSKIAVEEFFSENNMEYKSEVEGELERFKSDNLDFYCGDFFAYTNKSNQHFDFYFDRACIVALPFDIRSRFYNKVETLLAKHTDIFILTFAHDGPKDFGPPFYVPENELLEAYKNMGFDLNYIKVNETKAEGRFKDAGIKTIQRLKWKNTI
jgi:thiopurine S-methyltransferase